MLSGVRRASITVRRFAITERVKSSRETTADSIRYTVIWSRISVATRRQRSGKRNSALRSKFGGTVVRLPLSRSGTTARRATGSTLAIGGSRNRRLGPSSALASSAPRLAADIGDMLFGHLSLHVSVAGTAVRFPNDLVCPLVRLDSAAAAGLVGD